MSVSRRLTYAGLTLIIAGCGGENAGGSRGAESGPPAFSTPAPVGPVQLQTPSDTWQRERGSQPRLDEWIYSLANGVDTMVTLGSWLERHPADDVELRLPTGMDRDSFCRSAVTLDTVADRVWRRSAVFVIPPPPPGEALPDTSAVAARWCRMRALWFESTEPDSTLAIQAAVSLQEQFSRLLGNARPGTLMTGPGTGTWHAGASWVRGPRVVVVGADPGGVSWSETDTVQIVEPTSVVALSFVVGPEMDTTVESLVDKIRFPKVGAEALTSLARGDSAVRWSRLSGLEPLRRVFAHRRDSTGFDSTGQIRKDPSIDSALLEGLAALRDTASLPPRQRAAAFLAADLAVQLHARWLDYQGRDTLRRRQLERLGARYDYDQLGAVHIYLRPWLWRAYQLDSLGPAGRAAFAELMGEGWTTEIACRGGTNMTGEVITRGERAVENGVDDPMLHLYLAQAYADVASLSPDSIPGSAPDSLRSQAQRSERARLRSIEHYRKALEGIRDPGHRRGIWNDAVRLMLRRPTGTRYLCHWD